MAKSDNKTETESSTWRNLGILWRYTAGKRWLIVAYIVVAVVSGLTDATEPYFTGKIVAFISQNSLRLALVYVLCDLGLRIVVAITSYLKTKVYFTLNPYVHIGLVKHLTREIFKLEQTEVDERGTGYYTERVVNDCGSIFSDATDLIDAVFEVVPRLFVIVLVAMISWQFFVYWLIALTALILFSSRRNASFRKTKRQQRQLKDESVGLLTEIIRGFRDVRLLNAGTAANNRISKKANQAIMASNSITESRSNLNVLYSLFRGLLYTGNIALGIFLISHGWLSVANMLIIVIYWGRIASITGWVADIVNSASSFNVSCNRIFQIIDGKSYQKEEFGVADLLQPRGEIKFEHVSFSYSNSPNRKVLNDVAFDIKPNTKVAFVGRSGAGKTTIANLITRLYHKGSGEIYIDDAPIDSLTKDAIRDNITEISQSPYIFNFSVRDNLELAKPDATLSEIRAACQVAQIDDYIMNLPDKYDSVLGENGVELSGGQKQRIAIARALLRGSKVIIFDEATSALDNETQAAISEAINALQDKTVIMIAHRLSTIVNADMIYMLDNGVIAAAGNHDELMKSCMAYRNLYKSEELTAEAGSALS